MEPLLWGVGIILAYIIVKAIFFDNPETEKERTTRRKPTFR